MSRFTHQMTSYWQQMLSVMRNEFRTIFTDAGVVLILVLALIIYATVYSMAYGAQVLRNVPIGVVDECRTPTSRSLIETFNAGPNTYVAYNPTSMEEAKDLLQTQDLRRGLHSVGLRGETARRPAGQRRDLRRRQLLPHVPAGVSGGRDFDRRHGRDGRIPASDRQAGHQPPAGAGHDPAGRSTSPTTCSTPIWATARSSCPRSSWSIIQQTMLIGIGMIGGTWREFGLYRKLVSPDRKRMSTLPIVLGEALVYGMIYSVTTFYILGLHYRLFHYPMNGATGTIVVFMLAYMAACIALGIAISTLLPLPREFAAAVVVDLDSAADAQRCLLSPRRHSRLAVRLGGISPSSHGENAFIRIQSMGASLSEVLPEIRMLCILALVYGGLACIGIHLVLNRADKDDIPAPHTSEPEKVTVAPKHPQEPPRPVRKKPDGRRPSTPAQERSGSRFPA